MFQSLELYCNQKIDLEIVLKTLVAFRYRQVKKVSDVGEFCSRGGILDIYPRDFQEPVRIDFFDDEIQSISSFDLVT